MKCVTSTGNNQSTELDLEKKVTIICSLFKDLSTSFVKLVMRQEKHKQKEFRHKIISGYITFRNDCWE